MVDAPFIRSIALASLICVTPVTMAQAQEGCTTLAEITKQLATGKYHESPVARAIASGGSILIVYASSAGETWTLVGVRPEHAEIGCLLGAGTDWQPSALPGRPS